MRLHTYITCGWLLLAAGAPLSAHSIHGPSSQNVATPVGPKIKVLLAKDVPSAFLEAKGQYRVVRKDSGSILSQGAVGKRFVVHALQEGLRWGEEYPDIYQISLVPMAQDSYVLVNGIQYQGNVSIYHVRNNLITIVNEIAIEDYLKSTLAIQFEKPLSKEAMAALAITARTDAYNQVLQGKVSACPWDVTAQEACYFGFGVTGQKNGVEEAVDWSRYMVLESLQPGTIVQNIHLLPEAADKLAQKGFDAQKILKTTFPHAKMGITIDAKDIAVR